MSDWCWDSLLHLTGVNVVASNPFEADGLCLNFCLFLTSNWEVWRWSQVKFIGGWPQQIKVLPLKFIMYSERPCLIWCHAPSFFKLISVFKLQKLFVRLHALWYTIWQRLIWSVDANLFIPDAIPPGPSVYIVLLVYIWKTNCKCEVIFTPNTKAADKFTAGPVLAEPAPGSGFSEATRGGPAYSGSRRKDSAVPLPRGARTTRLQCCLPHLQTKVLHGSPSL